MIRIESTGCVLFSKVTNLEKILRCFLLLSIVQRAACHQTLLALTYPQKLLAGFYHRHANLFGWPAADTHILEY
jgi:hypothetical protein